MNLLILFLVFVSLICFCLRAFNVPVKPHLGWLGVALLTVAWLIQHVPLR